MLVRDYDEMKPFIPAMVMKGAPTLFDDALSVAQDMLVEQIIGTALETQLETRSSSDARLLCLCQRAISQHAFLRCIPDLDLVLTDAGFAVVNNEKTTMASTDRVRSLADNMAAKLDESRDALVRYLLHTSAYDSWRGTEEFARLSDGLILTLGEFRDVAVLNNLTAKAYPKSWSDFVEMNSALNVALMTDVASYISKDYAEELIEKTRDKEIFRPIEQKVLKLVKIAIAAIALGDRNTGLDQTMAAVAVMKANPDDFETYMQSPESKAVNMIHADTPIFSMI